MFKFLWNWLLRPIYLSFCCEKAMKVDELLAELDDLLEKKSMGVISFSQNQRISYLNSRLQGLNYIKYL